METALFKLSKGYDEAGGVAPPLPFSSVTGEGRKALWSKIRDGLLGKLDGPAFDDDDDDDEYETIPIAGDKFYVDDFDNEDER